MRPVQGLVSPAGMSQDELDELWAFFSPMVTRPREAFEQTLRKFPDLRTWRHPQDGRLVGFSAANWLVVDVDGQPTDVLYFGWAAVHQELRGRGLPFQDGFRRFIRQALWRPRRPGYVIFAASTYKSYRSLLRFGPRSWPRPGHPMPERAARTVAAVMARVGEEHYDPATGVLRRFGVQRYREGVYADEPERLADPLVAFYAASNPGQHEGDTLLVAYELTLPNILAWGLRALLPGGRR